MAPLTFNTPFNLSLWDGGEHEFNLLLKFNFARGYPDTHDEQDAATVLRSSAFA